MDRFVALRRRAELLHRLRAFFDCRGYLAVETPQLCPTPIPEAHIALFETRGADGAPQWLLPSPEYHLKKLLAAGSGNLYEITHSFRNAEQRGPQHSAEFTMLEYYTVDADGETSRLLTEELLRELQTAAGGAGPGPDPRILTMQEAWARWAGIDLASTLDGFRGDASALATAITGAGLGMEVRPDESWEDLFQRVFLTYVEPELPNDRPVFLTRYPAAIQTLARRIPGTPWADRWELYLGGVEVANCFGEETDPATIAAFFDEQRNGKRCSGLVDHAVETGYLSDPPLPRCSGVAMGVDRMVMHYLGFSDIRQVLTFHYG